MWQSLTAIGLALALALTAATDTAAQTADQPQKLTPMHPTPAPKPAIPPASAAIPIVPQPQMPAAPAVPAPQAAAPAPAPTASTPLSGAAVSTAAPGPAPRLELPQPAAPSCLPEIAKAEKRYHIPDGLLVSIALVESGRRDPDTGYLVPWPWTINSHGEGAYFENVDGAADAAGKLLARDDGLVDVGCMQVDLYHHPHAFQNLLAAFDPETNVDYAAKFLVELKEKNNSWISAVAAYNAGDPKLGGEYVARVLYYWKDLGTTAESAQMIAAGNSERRGFEIDTRPAPLEIAASFIEKKDYQSAVAIYRAVLTSDPDDQTALLGLAQTLHATGRNDDARTQLERLLTENPSNRAALATLLNIVDEMPPPQRLTALLSARQVVPSSAQIPARLAMLEQNRGNTNEAISEMGAAVRLAPDDPVLRLDYALLLDRGNYRAASIAAYTQFLEMYRPDNGVLTVPIDQVRQRLIYLRTHAQ